MEFSKIQVGKYFVVSSNGNIFHKINNKLGMIIKGDGLSHVLGRTYNLRDFDSSLQECEDKPSIKLDDIFKFIRQNL